MCRGRCYIVLGFAAGHRGDRTPPPVLPYVATALVRWWDARMVAGVESTETAKHRRIETTGSIERRTSDELLKMDYMFEPPRNGPPSASLNYEGTFSQGNAFD